MSVEFIDGSSTTISAKIAMIVADEPAPKEILQCKGHAGKMPCSLCKNATLESGFGGQPPLWQTNEYCVSRSETDIRKFDVQTNASIRDHVRRLNDYKATLNDADFQEKTEIYGFSYNPSSVVLDAELDIDIADAVHYDWVMSMYVTALQMKNLAGA